MPDLRLIATYRPRFKTPPAEAKHDELRGALSSAGTHAALNTAKATLDGYIMALEAFRELPATDCQLLRAEVIRDWSRRADQLDGINLRGLSGWLLFDDVIIVAGSACGAMTLALERWPDATIDDIAGLSGFVLQQPLLRDADDQLTVDGLPLCELIARAEVPGILGTI